jgi:hypothetical protein
MSPEHEPPPRYTRYRARRRLLPGREGERSVGDGPLEIGRRVSATTIQTVGAKGYDGFTLALVLDR